MSSREGNGLGRAVLVTMIPVNLVLLAWVWFGRVAFGAYGWFLLLMLYVLPFLALAMLITTVMSFRRSSPPRSLTRGQALAQLAMWAAMLGFGFFLVDFGDTDGSDLSAFTQVVGRNDTTLSISWTATTVCGVVTVVAWLFLVVLLVAQRRGRAQVAYA